MSGFGSVSQNKIPVALTKITGHRTLFTEDNTIHHYIAWTTMWSLPVPVAARLLRLWVRIPPGAWMFVCCECCVLSDSGLCDGLITRPEESYRLWSVVVCDQETSNTRRINPPTGLWKYNHNGL